MDLLLDVPVGVWAVAKPAKQEISGCVLEHHEYFKDLFLKPCLNTCHLWMLLLEWLSGELLGGQVYSKNLPSYH